VRLICSRIIGYLMESWGPLAIVVSLLFPALIIMDCHDKPTVPGGGGDDTLQVEVWLLVVDPNDYAVSGAQVYAGEAGTSMKLFGYTSPPGYFDLGNHDYDSSTIMEAEIKKPGFVPIVDSFHLTPQKFQIHEIILPFDSCFVTVYVGFRIQDSVGNPLNGAELSVWRYPGCAWTKPFHELEGNYNWTPDSIPILSYLVDSTRLYLEIFTSINGFVDRSDTVSLVAEDTVISNIVLNSDGGN